LILSWNLSKIRWCCSFYSIYMLSIILTLYLLIHVVYQWLRRLEALLLVSLTRDWFLSFFYWGFSSSRGGDFEGLWFWWNVLLVPLYFLQNFLLCFVSFLFIYNIFVIQKKKKLSLSLVLLVLVSNININFFYHKKKKCNLYNLFGQLFVPSLFSTNNNKVK
jgi:hypothetical protein